MNKKTYVKFIDFSIPMSVCNLNCSYCYVNKKEIQEPIPPLKYPVDYITQKCLSKERLGGNAIINFCAGGETTLYPELFNIVKDLLAQGHVVNIVSNGTASQKYDEYLQLPQEYLSRLFFKFSFHYLELKRKNLLNVYAENVKKILNSPASFTIEMGASDDYIPYLDEIKQYSMENFGALPHVTVLRDSHKPNIICTKLNRRKYKKIWDEFNSEMFNIRLNYWHSSNDKTYCFAGYFSYTIDLINGILRPCSFISTDISPFEKNIFENADEEIPNIPIGPNCPSKHCVNCHAYLAWGDKPQLNTPTYASIRNRIMPDGREWLKETIKEAFNTKLYETNPDYQEVQQRYPKGCIPYYPNKNKNSLLENIFSVKNRYSNNIKRKVITVCGAKIKIKCGSGK